jgi:tetratricopeptide (TPR) repeat protein
MPYVVVAGPYGVSTYVPPLFAMAPGGLPPVVGPDLLAPPIGFRGPVAPLPPPELNPLVEKKAPAGPAGKAQRIDPGRASQLVTLGDRLFRAGNFKKAEERFQQAARADPNSATPRVHLAQIAVVRGQYGEAAKRLREALTAQPNWLATAPDIEAIYGEPTEFARQIARLQSHLQVHPEDRDAWLVLGAQWFLSGRTASAADVFQRLNDPRRQPDIALAAFLEATNQGEARPRAAAPAAPGNDPFH